MQSLFQPWRYRHALGLFPKQNCQCSKPHWQFLF
jgi:hypothetical protein